LKNKILAVCDSEEAYVGRLMEYLNGKQISPFYVRSFTSWEALEDFAQQEEIEVLLVSADIAGEEMRSPQMGKRILLSTGQVPEGLEKEPVIYKYQSAEKIIREVLNYYAEAGQPFLQAAIWRGEVRIYGVYSPLGRLGKTTFALAFGMACARRRRTLYLNLEAYSGFEELKASLHEWNLGDLLYFLKKGKQGFLYKLKSVTQNLEYLDYISPVLSLEDLLAVTEEEWEILLERLVKDAGYECLVIDFSDSIQGLFGLLGKCGCIYMPVLEDGISQAKLGQFEKILELRGYENLREIIHRIKLPQTAGRENSGGLIVPEEMKQFAEELDDW
jgi:cellulose biosynthesis protein BcsQ